MQIDGCLEITKKKSQKHVPESSCDVGRIGWDGVDGRHEQPSHLRELGHLPKMSGNKREATGSHARPIVSQPDL